MSVLSKLRVTKRFVLPIPGLVVGAFGGIGLFLVVGGSAGAVLAGFFGGGVVGAAAGYLIGRRWDARAWAATGRELGLTPESDGSGLLAGVSTLVGTVDGHRVRLSQESSPTEAGGGRRIDTRVEVAVDPPAEAGVLAYRTADSRTDGGAVFGSVGDGSGGAVDESAVVVEEAPFTAVGPTEETARAVVSGRAREALLDANLTEVRVGDPSHAFVGADSGLEDVPMGSMISGMVDDVVGGDPATATTAGHRGLVVETETLERQIAALVAAVEAFDAARDRAKRSQ